MACDDAGAATDNFIKWLVSSQSQIDLTKLKIDTLKVAAAALNMVFAMFASWAISAGMNAFINWMKNAKTHSEQLISTMEDAHDAAEEAQQDVDDIQQKLDDLDQQIKDLGAEKIEDIVDPQEKAKIQEINNLLETQLRLKKQIADDESNKANKAASDVFNDKSEVVVSNETPTSYAEADPNGIGVTVTPSKNVTRTEALREHTARVNELSDAYVKLMSDENATDEERAQAKKNLEDEISLTNDAGTKVSELADMYETDASKYGDVSAEVQECTDSMQGASDALERANNLLNGTTSVENTNLDAFKSKFKDVIEEIDNGYLSMQEAIAQYKELSPLQAFGSMTGEAIINIDSDTAHQTEAEATALAKLHEIADANNISFEDLISAFEQLGIVATSDTSGIANYATQLEETMKAIDSLQSSYKSCSSAVEEYNKYGYLSIDTMQSLLQMDTEYLNCLDLKDGKLQINKQRYAELLAAQYAQAEVEAIDQAITELNTIAKGDAAEKTQTLTTATEDEKNKLVALCPALEDATVGTGELAAALAAAQGAANGGNAEQIQAQIDAVMGALNTKITLLKKNTQAAISSGTSLGNQLNGFNEKTNKANKNNKSTAKSVTDVSSAFDTLNKAIKEYNQYGYLCADTAKSLVGLEDKFTACLTKQGDKLQINVEQFRKFVKEQLKEANAAKDGGKSADEMNKILNYLDQNVDTTTISFEQLTDAIKGYGTAMDEAKEKTDAIKSAFSGLSDVLKTLSESQFGIPDLDATEKQIEAIQQLVPYAPELISAAIDENGNINLDTDKFKKALINALKEQARVAKETGGAGAEAMAQAYTNAAASIEKNLISVDDYINGLGTDLSNANTVLDEYQNTWTTLMDAMKEQNANGQLTQDTQQKLMELKPEFRALLTTDENGNATVNVRELRNLYQAQLEKLAKEFKDKPIGIQAEAMIKDIREPTPEEYKELAKKTVKFQLALAKYTKRIAEIESNGNLSEDEYLQQKAEADAELNQALQDSLNDVKETDADVTVKLKKHWEGVESVIDNFKNALSDVKDVLNSFLSLIEKFNDKSNNDLKLWGDVMGDVIDKRIEALNKQKEALEENNDATERAIELAKAQDELARAEQQRTSRVYTENGYEWQADPEAVRTARQDLNDKQRQWNKEDAEKAIDDQIKKYNEFKDKLSEVMEDIGTSWDDYNKKLQYTAQIQEMTLGQMVGSLDGYHNKIIASLQNSGTISGIQTVISNLESLIGTLEKLNNVYNFLQTGTYTDGGFVGLVKTVKKVFGKNSSTSITKTITNSLDTITDATEVTFGGSGITGVINNSMTDGVKNAVVNAQKELGSATTKNGLIGVFQNAWDAIGSGAKSLFSNSSSNSLTSIFSDGISNIGKIISNAFGGKGAGTSGGSGILGWLGNLLGIGGVSLSSVPAMTATNTAGLTGLSKLMADGAIGANVAGAGGTAAAAAGGSSLLAGIPIVSALLFGLGAAGNHFAGLNKIWKSNDDTGTKIGKTLFSTAFNSLGGIFSIAGLIHDTIGRANDKKNGTTSKTLAEKVYEWPIWFWNWGKKTTSQLDDMSKNTKDTADDVKKKENKTNITVNAVQTTVNNGNKTSDSSGPSGSSSSSVSNGQQKQQSFWDKFWGSKFWFWNWGKKAVGDKGVKHTGTYNVDEQGSELIVRQPQSGRYTYLETGDGVVPADITSRLFEMGGNPDKWFTDQMAKHSTATMVQSRNPGGISMTIGDVNVNNPVGDTDALARQIVQQLPNKMVQRLNKR